jgi:hypothetical protein
MPRPQGNGAEDSGQSTVTEPTSAEEKAATLALENDDTSWDDGEEVESRFEANDEDDSAATDEDDSDAEEFEDDGESEDESDDADSEEGQSTDEENDQDAEDSDVSDAESTTDIEAERKRHNDEMAQARIEAKKARDEAEAIRKQAQDATIQQYLDEAGEDEAERARRELNVEQFNIREERISLNNEKLQGGLERALTSIDLFRTGSPAAKEELASSLDSFEREFIVLDKNNRPVEIKIDPATGKQADVVAYLQRKADAIRKLQGEGASQQVKSKKKEKSRTLTPPSRAPKKAKVDPDLAGFDEEAAR